MVFTDLEILTDHKLGGSTVDVEIDFTLLIDKDDAIKIARHFGIGDGVKESVPNVVNTAIDCGDNVNAIINRIKTYETKN